MDAMARLVFNRFNDLSARGHPSEHTRFLNRENPNKRMDEGILEKERRGKKQPEEMFKEE